MQGAKGSLVHFLRSQRLSEWDDRVKGMTRRRKKTKKEKDKDKALLRQVCPECLVCLHCTAARCTCSLLCLSNKHECEWEEFRLVLETLEQALAKWIYPAASADCQAFVKGSGHGQTLVVRDVKSARFYYARLRTYGEWSRYFGSGHGNADDYLVNAHAGCRMTGGRLHSIHPGLESLRAAELCLVPGDVCSAPNSHTAA
jgi:hypothetical protein